MFVSFGFPLSHSSLANCWKIVFFIYHLSYFIYFILFIDSSIDFHRHTQSQSYIGSICINIVIVIVFVIVMQYNKLTVYLVPKNIVVFLHSTPKMFPYIFCFLFLFSHTLLSLQNICLWFTNRIWVFGFSTIHFTLFIRIIHSHLQSHFCLKPFDNTGNLFV